MTSGLVIAMLVSVTAIAGMPGEGQESGTTVVRVAAEDSSEFDRLGLNAATDVDFGSFRWLRLASAQLKRMSRAGVKFTILDEANRVHVMDFQFDPLAEGEPVLPERLRSNPERDGLRLLQFAAPVTDEAVKDLQQQGITLLQYYPYNTYLFWGGPGNVEAIENARNVRWHGLFHPAFKINSELESFAGTIRNVSVLFYDSGRPGSIVEAFEKNGANIIQVYPAQPDKAFFNAIIEVDADRIEGLARIPEVLWIGYSHPEPILEDEMSDQIIADNHPGGVPVVGYESYLDTLGFDGTEVIWAPIDTGVDYDHPDLVPSIVGGYSFPDACVGYPAGSDCGGGGHGTHVAGIIGGTAVGDAGGPYTDAEGFLYGLGVAPGYSIFAMNSLSGSAWPPAGGWQEHSKQAVLGNAVGGNNSWTTGEGTQHGYQASERTHDIMVLDGNFDTAEVAEPFIEVFSAGNSGSSGLTAPKEGKNLIVSAASVNYRAGNIDSIASFSSRGPAVDGRVVPTITSPGEQIASTRNDEGGNCGTAIGGTNGLYSFCSGTSMAAPHTSGAVVLATEWWRTFNGGADPSPAMAKALLVNSADDIGTADIPNDNEGWGRINVNTLIDPPVSRIYRDQDHVFTATGQQLVIPMVTDDSGQPLKVTLAWSDAPGAVGANPALVNNLDLRVTTGGTTYLGNNFVNGWSVTGGSADTINNLENVYVNNPGGDVLITIDATQIAGDAVLYDGDATDQSFALVCTNCVLEPGFYLSADPSSRTICAPADAFYDIDVGSILGYDVPVTLSASGEPLGSSVDFNPNPVVPGNASILTVSDTDSATPGVSTIDITGVTPTITQTTRVALTLSNASPAAPSLIAPSDGAADQPARPTFEWTTASQAETYRIQIATDQAFANIVVDESGLSDTEFNPSTDLMTNTFHWWRVQADNACGTGTWSAVWSFSTLAVPGDCGIGTMPLIHYDEDFESGAPGWTTGGTGSTWVLGTGVTGPYSGSYVYHADNVEQISDQWLISPSLVLPAAPYQTALNLQFWNYQELEDASSGCFDGGLLEITTDGGSSWTQLPTSVMQTDPYDGPVDDGYSNPLAGLDAWCGDPQDWLRSVVDLDSYAGETVRFRFRLGTDSLVSHPGWDLDDVWVQSCVPANGELFTDGFESSDTSAWSSTTVP